MQGWNQVFLTKNCRVLQRWHTAYGHICRVCILCRVSESQAHGKHGLCRVLGPLPCVAFLAHGKGYVCRVPDMWHTAKLLAHGNQRVSGSACPFLVYQHLSLRYIGGAHKLDRSLILLWLWRASFMIAFTRSFQKGSTPSYIKRLHEKAREIKIKVYIK